MSGTLLDVGAVLSEYPDPNESTQWPRASRELPPRDVASQLDDPCKKPALVGPWNTLHDLLSVLETFDDMPFTPTANELRWTPHGTTGFAGARIYGHPRDTSAAAWLYNGHDHGLSPKRNICSYDLVRLARFGALDKDVPAGTAVQELPSSNAMNAWIRAEHPDVVAEYERRQNADIKFEDLDAKARAQPNAETPKANARKPLVFHKTPRDILTRQLPEQRFALYPFFPCGTTSLLISMGGLGKTYLLLLLGLCIALGLEFNGQRCTPGRVVFVSGEDDLDELLRRQQRVLRYLVETLGVVIDWDLLEANFHVVDRVGCGAENMMVQALSKGFVPTDFPAFLAAQIGSAALTVLDTKSRFASATDENDNSAGSAFIGACEIVASRTGGAVCVLAHTGKAVAREGIVDQYSIRGASSLADDARSVMVLAPPTDVQKKKYEFDLEALELNDVFRMAHVKHNRSKKADDVFLQRQDYGVVTPFTPKRRYIMTSEERMWQLIQRIGVSEISRRKIKDEYRAIFGAACTRDRAYEIFDAAIREGLLTLTRSHGQTDYYRASDKALEELATRRPPVESWDDIVAQPTAAASSRPMPESTSATVAEAPKERKGCEKPAKSDVPLDRVEGATAVVAARPEALLDIVFRPIETAAQPEAAPAAPQSAEWVDEPTPTEWMDEPTPAEWVDEPTPAEATSNGFTKPAVHLLIEQLGAKAEDAYALVNADYDTAEKVAQASEAKLIECGIHKVFAKTLKNAAHKWLATQRAARPQGAR